MQSYHISLRLHDTNLKVLSSDCGLFTVLGTKTPASHFFLWNGHSSTLHLTRMRGNYSLTVLCLYRKVHWWDARQQQQLKLSYQLTMDDPSCCPWCRAALLCAPPHLSAEGADRRALTGGPLALQGPSGHLCNSCAPAAGTSGLWLGAWPGCLSTACAGLPVGLVQGQPVDFVPPDAICHSVHLALQNYFFFPP